MRIFRSLVVRSLSCIALPVTVASGQRLTSPTIDLGVEGWNGGAESRVFSNHSGLAVGRRAIWRARSSPRGAVIVGGGASVQRVVALGDKCRISPGGSGGCAPDYPAFSSLALLGGLEGTFGATVRVVGGPAVFHAASGTAAGLQGSADLATPSAAHLSLVLSARGALIPTFREHRHQIGALGLGLRIR